MRRKITRGIILTVALGLTHSAPASFCVQAFSDFPRNHYPFDRTVHRAGDRYLSIASPNQRRSHANSVTILSEILTERGLLSLSGGPTKILYLSLNERLLGHLTPIPFRTELASAFDLNQAFLYERVQMGVVDSQLRILATIRLRDGEEKSHAWFLDLNRLTEFSNMSAAELGVLHETKEMTRIKSMEDYHHFADILADGKILTLAHDGQLRLLDPRQLITLKHWPTNFQPYAEGPAKYPTQLSQLFEDLEDITHADRHGPLKGGVWDQIQVQRDFSKHQN